MVFFLEITNNWQTSLNCWFADFFLEIFKIHRLVWIFLWIFGCFECVLSVFCLKLLIIFQQLLDIVFQMLTLVVFHTFWGFSSFPIYLLDALDLLLEKVGLQEVAKLTVPLIGGHPVQLQQAFVHLDNQKYFTFFQCSGFVCFWASWIRIRILPSTSKKNWGKPWFLDFTWEKKNIFCWYLDIKEEDSDADPERDP